jgi:hypothetical protein
MRVAHLHAVLAQLAPNSAVVDAEARTDSDEGLARGIQLRSLSDLVVAEALVADWYASITK